MSQVYKNDTKELASFVIKIEGPDDQPCSLCEIINYNKTEKLAFQALYRVVLLGLLDQKITSNIASPAAAADVSVDVAHRELTLDDHLCGDCCTLQLEMLRLSDIFQRKYPVLYSELGCLLQKNEQEINIALQMLFQDRDCAEYPVFKKIAILLVTFFLLGRIFGQTKCFMSMQHLCQYYYPIIFWTNFYKWENLTGDLVGYSTPTNSNGKLWDLLCSVFAGGLKYVIRLFLNMKNIV